MIFGMGRIRRECLAALSYVLALLASLVALAMLTAPAAFAEGASSSALAEQASRIDAGGAHTCKILERGSVRCWGEGNFGRLGYGNTVDIGDTEQPNTAGPVNVGPGRSAVAVSAGGAHTCAVLDDHSVRCWGLGVDGRLGYGNPSSIGDDEAPGSVAPVDLGPGRSAIEISAGGAHTCALLDDGTVRCWGEGDNGRLGYSNTTDIGDTEAPGSVGPVDLGVGRFAVAISAGGSHTCALLDDGTVRCWGEGDNGRLGYSNTTDIGDTEAPGSVGPVDLGADRQAVAISAGGAHTCALLDNGSVRCWGLGTNGRLGYGNTTDIGDTETPGSVAPVDVGSGRNAVAISAGDSHTCARLENGTTRCWGLGTNGRLGYGNTTDIGDTETPGSVGPVDVGSGRRTVAITAAGEHTCARLENGSTRCWGEAASGQLGYGNTNDIGDTEAPGTVGPVNVGADPRIALGRSVIRVAAGGAHTCALLDDGNVRCWGEAESGQLGYGNTTDIGDTESPGAFGPVNLGNGAATEITAGIEHTCALLDNGTVRCWGSGSSVHTVNLGVGRSAVAVSAGSAHTCAVLDNGDLRCWGSGADGRLGRGNTDNVDEESAGSVAPVDLGFGRSAVDISAGNKHTCAILDNGRALCWGSNAEDQLGYPGTDFVGDDEMPGTIGPVGFGAGIEATSISAGFDHTCARLDDGTVRCWGSGPDGRLGYPGVGGVSDPGAVGPISLGGGATDVDTGRDTDVVEGGHTCARLANGSVRCWGWNQNGQLGYGNTENIGDDELPSTAGPVDFGLGRSAVELSVGGQHDCAVLDQGDLKCWGFGEAGRLGYGDADDVGDDETPGMVGSVDATDDPPVAVDDSLTVGEDASATAVPVLANEDDPDQGPKQIVSAGDPANGTVAITGGGSGLTYRPDPDYCNTPSGAPDTFTYTLNGGSSATVSVTVTCVDDPANAVDDSFTITEDDPPAALAVLANDTDADGGSFAIAAASDPPNGTVAVDADGGGLTYAPDANFCNSPNGSPDRFTYTLNGGSSATVSMTVNCDSEPGTGGGTGGGPEVEDRTAPETTFTTKPKVTTKTKRKRAKLKFGFAANEAVSRFECSFNGARYRECTTPLTLRVKRGTHTFDVRAIDLAGNVDPTPATWAFEVLKKKK